MLGLYQIMIGIHSTHGMYREGRMGPPVERKLDLLLDAL